MGNFRSFGNNGSRGGGFGGGGRGGFGGNRGGFGGGRGGFNRNDRERRMFGAVCAECGENCEVPFKPDGSKPVLCSKCFKNEKGGDNRRFSAFEDFEDNRPKKFEVVCAACGKNCEVPFKPKEGKPVYCDSCFGKDDRRSDSRKSDAPVSNKEFEKLNMKLDAILKRLDLLLPTASVEIPAETTDTQAVTEEAPKKAAKAKKAPAKKTAKKTK